MIIYTPLLEQEIFEDEEQHESFHWLNVNHATVKL